MNQNENPMFPWDSSILPTAVPSLSGKLLLTVFFGVDEKRRLCSDHSLLFSIFFVFLFVYFLISYPQYCITSSQNIAFAQENHSLV